METKDITICENELGQVIKTVKVEKHYCEQCQKEMGFEWFLGSVCGKCCRENHHKVIGQGL